MTASPGSINLTQAELLLLAMTRPDRAALIIGPKYVPARALVAAEYMRPACEGEPWPLTAEGIRLALELVRGFSSAEACRELAQFQGSKAQRRRWFERLYPLANPLSRMPWAARGSTWPASARACPRCGCTPAAPCAMRWGDNAGTCVPAGVYELATCSACMPTKEEAHHEEAVVEGGAGACPAGR